MSPPCFQTETSGARSIVRAEGFSKDRGGLPKSHNGPVSPHLSVPLQKDEGAAHLAAGKQGTLRDSQGPLTDPPCHFMGHCPSNAGEHAAVCIRLSSILIQMS